MISFACPTEGFVHHYVQCCSQLMMRANRENRVFEYIQVKEATWFHFREATRDRTVLRKVGRSQVRIGARRLAIRALHRLCQVRSMRQLRYESLQPYRNRSLYLWGC